MKLKRYVIYIVMFMVLIFSAFLFTRPLVDTVVFQTQSGPVTVSVEVVQAQEELQRGLMFRTELGENSGMLFIFDRSQTLNFWMKNTLIPLDMIFISEEFEILKIERNVPPCKTVTCPNYGSVFSRYVVEVNGGFCDANGIKEGDKVNLLLNIVSSQN